MKMVFCRECGAKIDETVATCPTCGTKQYLTKPTKYGLPDGIRGFSWAAFLMNFIWGIGNRVWISFLILLVPLCLSGLFSLFDSEQESTTIISFASSLFEVAFGLWLGFKGRELAWNARQWESVEHFQRVQKRWSQWAVGLTITITTVSLLTMYSLGALDSISSVYHSKEKATIPLADAKNNSSRNTALEQGEVHETVTNPIENTDVNHADDRIGSNCSNLKEAGFDSKQELLRFLDKAFAGMKSGDTDQIGELMVFPLHINAKESTTIESINELKEKIQLLVPESVRRIVAASKSNMVSCNSGGAMLGGGTIRIGKRDGKIGVFEINIPQDASEDTNSTTGGDQESKGGPDEALMTTNNREVAEDEDSDNESDSSRSTASDPRTEQTWKFSEKFDKLADETVPIAESQLIDKDVPTVTISAELRCSHGNELKLTITTYKSSSVAEQLIGGNIDGVSLKYDVWRTGDKVVTFPMRVGREKFESKSVLTEYINRAEISLVTENNSSVIGSLLEWVPASSFVDRNWIIGVPTISGMPIITIDLDQDAIRKVYRACGWTPQYKVPPPEPPRGSTVVAPKIKPILNSPANASGSRMELSHKSGDTSQAEQHEVPQSVDTFESKKPEERQDDIVGAQLRTAAESGDIQSQIQFGLRFVNGTGIAKDPDTGYMWVAVAARDSNPDAVLMLKYLASQMTADQIQRDQARASRCISQGYKSCQ